MAPNFSLDSKQIAIQNKQNLGMYQMYSTESTAKPQEENTAAIKPEEEKAQVDVSTLKNIGISGNGEFSNLEEFGLNEENLSKDTLFSPQFKQRLANTLGSSNGQPKTVEGQNNSAKTILFETMGANSIKSEKFSELGQVLGIEQELCNSLPEEAQGIIKELQGVRNEFVSSLMQQAVSQWGNEYGKFEKLPENLQQELLSYVANFTSNIVQVMMNYNAQDNLKEA